MGTITACHGRKNTSFPNVVTICRRTDSDVSGRWVLNLNLNTIVVLSNLIFIRRGLTVDNGFRPAQWLNHWIYVETVLIQLRKTEDYSLLGCRREVKTFLPLNFFNF